MIRYVAFLRGINMIGHKVIPMTTLTDIFVSVGLRNVKTYGASGNVVFASEQSNRAILAHRIEKQLRASLGYEVKVFLRTVHELEQLVRLDPFGQRGSRPNGAKAVVTFLAEPQSSDTTLPAQRANKDFKIVRCGAREVFSLRYPLGDGRFGNVVAYIEKALGSSTTSRAWETVVKIAGASR